MFSGSIIYFHQGQKFQKFKKKIQKKKNSRKNFGKNYLERFHIWHQKMSLTITVCQTSLTFILWSNSIFFRNPFFYFAESEFNKLNCSDRFNFMQRI